MPDCGWGKQNPSFTQTIKCHQQIAEERMAAQTLISSKVMNKSARGRKCLQSCPGPTEFPDFKLRGYISRVEGWSQGGGKEELLRRQLLP